MPRRIREKILDSREARTKLKIRGKPYYRAIGPRLHLGYRKGKDARRWVARMYAGDGDYVVEVIGDADDVVDADGVDVLDFWQAQDRARDLLKRRSTADGVPVGAYTVKQVIDEYVEHLEGRPAHYEVKRRLAAYVPAALAGKQVAKLTKQELVAWHRALAKAPPRARTKKGSKQRYRSVDMHDAETIRRRKDSANRILAMLKAALNYALAEDKASPGPWQRIKPFKGVEAARARYLSFAEVKRLLNACKPDFRLLVHALLLTGCRYQEAARLRVEDFNADAGTLHIRLSKTGKERHVVLTDEGRRFFEQITAGRAGRDLMMGRVWGKSHQDKPMRAACARAKIEPHVGIHQLRHTWASHSVMAGMPLHVVARNLGHRDTRMVERHYGHLAPGYVADTIRQHAPRFGMVDPSNVRILGR